MRHLITIDQHVATTNEARRELNEYGWTIHDFNMSGHAPILGMRRTGIDMLEGDSWCSVVQNESVLREFTSRYSVPLRGRFDGAVALYPPVFAWLYRETGLPIVVHAAIRYDKGVDCDPVRWEEFNRFLRDRVDAGRVLLTANNYYDAYYMQAFVGREVSVVPTCARYTGMSWNPIHDTALMFGSFDPAGRAGDLLQKKHNVLPAGHAWQRVAEYKCAVWFPYNASIMSMFEHHAAGIPILCPTKEFLLDLYFSGEVPVLTQLTPRQESGRSPHSPIAYTSPYDPSAYDDRESLSWWLSHADYYSGVLKGIRYFGSWEELRSMLDAPLESFCTASDVIRCAPAQRSWNVVADWLEETCAK